MQIQPDRVKIKVVGLLALLVLAIGPNWAAAQQRKPIKIEQVQVGFGSTNKVSQYKSGFWTPVYVEVRAWEQGTTPQGELVVESVDTDDYRNRYTVPLKAMSAGEQLTIMTFTKPGQREISVSAVLDRRTVDTVDYDENVSVMDPSHRLFLVLGSNQALINRIMNPRKVQPGQQMEEDEGDYPDRDAPQKAVSETEVNRLPNRWFAYEGIDLVIMTTGNRDGFVMQLNNETTGRKEALLDWVRKGGKLIVSTAAAQDVVAQMPFLREALPVNVTGNLSVSSINLVAANVQRPLENRGSGGRPSGPFDIAKFEPKPGRELLRIVPPRVAGRQDPIVLATAAYGLGSITVVAFDLDRPPFKGWQGERDFWKWLIEAQVGAYTQPPQNRYYMGRSPEDPDISSQLIQYLEFFKEVPVISFGWVALFILLYIFVVGPLDYFFLKKVVKRLELTWITFPTVVILISVIAYFTAYALKGNDQRINKVDVLDFDLHGHQVHGNSWFTIFSPRIQHYTLGLEPNDTSWCGPGTKPAQDSVVLSWFGRSTSSFGGSGRGPSQGLFRRAYDYTPDANALSGVPIQVWSVKTFTANWQGSLDPNDPIIRSDIRRAAGDRGSNARLTGTIESRLPVKLEDVFMYSHNAGGSWYPLKDLLPGVQIRIDAVQNEPNISMSEWLSRPPQNYSREWNQLGGAFVNMPPVSAPLTAKRMMFFREQGSGIRNAGLRMLDQNWRLDSKDEIVLVARVARQEGTAEEVTADPRTPTKLWVGAAPAAGARRPDVLGSLTQETYVRINIPLRN